MSLLRRRMMMQKAESGFERIYDAVNGGLPTDDGWAIVNQYAYPIYSLDNQNDILTAHINHGQARFYLYPIGHETAETCSIEVEGLIHNSDLTVTLCDGQLYAQAAIAYFQSKLLCFPMNRSFYGTPSQDISQDQYYNLKIVKNNGKCSIYLDNVSVAEDMDCMTTDKMGTYPTDSRNAVSIGFAGVGSYNDSGFVTVKRIEYKEW